MEHPQALELVRISRIKKLEELICRIHLSTSDCIVVSELSDSLDLDGLCIIPTKTVRYFDRAFEKADYYQAALGAWRDVDCHTELVKGLSGNMIRDLQFVSNKGDTVAIHMELDDPDVCFVGTVHDVTDATLLLHRISAQGKPITEPLEVVLKSVTKVELSTRYLTAVGYAARVLAARP
jgi:hypothetical protein